MQEIKDTQRAAVRIGFDGRVHKRYKGPLAEKRYENEVRVLKYLEEKGCDFVPKLLEEHPEELYIVTTNCGHIVSRISKEKEKAVFDSLERFGVKHDDAFQRNITYSPHLGKFCVIDFEFAIILETGEGLTLKEAVEERAGNYERLKDD
ncbi:serine/threonine protein phosphatase [Pelagicoccus sp. SDUM812003]|uniref:serine/threonine protein phosphatase n=1 Tax=Pelagicoccus sp. SDUM812003 TaxID=3041267 RepID=UPI00280EF9FA|nr:serine/threonine protein phosphatase [Pelagicoccus sp. SDUM812003]MDQ8205321.1 serine/threonine protein phosphatase [Pelagicoccus sp. SDUM812003]